MSQPEDFIEKERKQGYPDKHIKEALLSKGWDEKTVDKAMSDPPHTLFYLLIAILIIAGGVGAYMIITSGEDIEMQENPPEEVQESVEAESCEDLKCLSEKALNCEEDEVRINKTTDMMGITVETNSIYQLTQTETGCRIYMETLSTKGYLNETTRQQLLEEGSTEEEIDQQLEMMNEQMKTTEGLSGTCIYPTNGQLSYILSEWDKGNMRTEVSCSLGTDGNSCTYGGDYENATCTGSMFSQ